MIWEQSKNAFYTAITFTMYFTLMAVIVLDSLGYVLNKNLYPTDMIKVSWGTDVLKDAINKLKAGIGVNVIVAIPQFILGIAMLLVQLLINSITLLQWILKQFLFIVFQLITLSEASANELSNIIAWIVETPIILGGTMALGQAIYTFISGGGNV